MKTIAISVSNGWAVREYLRSAFLPELARHARVVILSPLADDPAFRAAFESDNVAVEPLHIGRLGSVAREIERTLVFAHCYRHPSVMGANLIEFSSRAHKRQALRLKSRLRLVAVRPVARWTARRLARMLSIEHQERIEKLAYPHLRREAERLTGVLRTHRVDLMLSTMPTISHFDRPAVWAASAAGARSICCVPSWDNLYAKGRMPVRFSHYIVWGEWMERILRSQYPGLPASAVSQTGAIFLDGYRRGPAALDRGRFIQSIGGDPARPLMLWACAPKSQTPNQPQMIEEFLRRCRAGEVRGNPQLLVRPHPVGGGEHLRALRDAHPEILFTETNAGDPQAGLRWNPSAEDQALLVNSVRHADVLMNFSSSISLEAFAADRPVVNLAYDAMPASDYERTTLRAYTSESYRPVVDMGATAIARSADELTAAVDAYLADPSLQRRERAALLHLICGTVDGGAAERVARVVLNEAGAIADMRAAG